MSSRSYTNFFIIMRNKASQKRHTQEVYYDTTYSDEVSLVASVQNPSEISNEKLDETVFSAWSSEMECIQYNFSCIPSKLSELLQLHQKHLTQPSLNDNSKLEAKIDILTNDITKMLSSSQRVLQILRSKNPSSVNKNNKETRLHQNLVLSMAIRLQELLGDFKKAQSSYLFPHGTFIGSIRLEAHRPTQLPVDSEFHFGASTRKYVLRERPQTAPKPIMEELERTSEETDGGLLGLPESETELDNLTEFNTAHNRRISMLGIADEDISTSTRKRKKLMISFNEEEEIINPEDVDPTVGRFRNLVHTTVIPTKSTEDDILLSSNLRPNRHHFGFPNVPSSGLYSELPPEQTQGVSSHSSFPSSLSSKLGIAMPNPAPEVDIAPYSVDFAPPPITVTMDSSEPKKKKYLKEIWPGKKSFPSLLI